MNRVVILALTLLIVACRSAIPKLDSPPSAKGVLPGQTVWQAAQALGPLKWDVDMDDEGRRGFEFATGRIYCRAGVIDKIVTESLEIGTGSVESGNNPTDVRVAWGPDENRFERDGRDLSLYLFEKCRYELEWKEGVLKSVEITRESPQLSPGSPPYGKGVLGDDLRTEPGISLDGVALGWTRGRVEDALGKSNDRLWGSSGSYGPQSGTIVGYADSRVHWVLGNQLRQEERIWVEVGMSVDDATKNLAKVARVKQYSGSWMVYTFLNVGDVSVAIQNGKVVGIELYDPQKGKK